MAFLFQRSKIPVITGVLKLQTQLKVKVSQRFCCYEINSIVSLLTSFSQIPNRGTSYEALNSVFANTCPF